MVQMLSELREKCRSAIKKGNMEQCFDFLEEGLANGKETEAIHTELILLQARLNSTLRERGIGTDDSYKEARQQISLGILTLLGTLEDKHINFLNRINDQILIFSPYDKVAEWQRMFSEKNFSHALVLASGTEVPINFRSPDVVLFDDTGPNVRPEMVRFAAEMPQAHFLYFGKRNPMEDNAAIFERCANANSKFTVHARLRELLEFRKIYGVPAATNS